MHCMLRTWRGPALVLEVVLRDPLAFLAFAVAIYVCLPELQLQRLEIAVGFEEVAKLGA